MEAKNLESIFDELDGDPMLVQLFIAINRYPGITANRLKELLFIDGTKIYYYLSKLENKNFIKVEEEITKRNLIQKKYFSITKPISEEEMLEGFRKAKKREFLILKLSFLSTLIQKQINNLKCMSKEDFERLNEQVLDLGSLFTIKGKYVPASIEKNYLTLQNSLLQEANELFGSSLEERIKESTHIAFFGFIPLD
jgi:DNA-binding PadR family transcriptional regulator